MKFLILFLIVIVLVSGCAENPKPTGLQELTIDQKAAQNCIYLCKSSKEDLSNGPCLSDNNSNWTVSDWVCDVAHLPRQNVDNLPENQCSDFREGRAHHFVEVYPNCSFIRVV